MLRHTYATMLFDAGVDVKSAQRFLGHEDIEVMLSIYTHLTKYKETYNGLILLGDASSVETTLAYYH